MRQAARRLTRSEVMSRVKGKDTVPEIRVRRALWAMGLRYRLHAKELPGQPDVVFRGSKLAIFVHGCFWHRHPNCPHARMPKSRVEFWTAKLGRNAERDIENELALRRSGWDVLTVWECQVRDEVVLSYFVAQVGRIIGKFV